jgi:hypothetical protein
MLDVLNDQNLAHNDQQQDPESDWPEEALADKVWKTFGEAFALRLAHFCVLLFCDDTDNWDRDNFYIFLDAFRVSPFTDCLVSCTRQNNTSGRVSVRFESNLGCSALPRDFKTDGQTADTVPCMKLVCTGRLLACLPTYVRG